MSLADGDGRGEQARKEGARCTAQREEQWREGEEEWSRSREWDEREREEGDAQQCESMQRVRCCVCSVQHVSER